MAFLTFIRRIFGLGRRFNGTPEQFLGMAQYLAFKNNPEFSVKELLQWGDVMQKIMKVKLHPYKDFHDLAINGKADLSLMNKVEGKLKEVEQRKELKQAIYGPNADLGDDDIFKSQSEGAIFARKMAKDLAKHVNLHDEDQAIIDKL